MSISEMYEKELENYKINREIQYFMKNYHYITFLKVESKYFF